MTRRTTGALAAAVSVAALTATLFVSPAAHAQYSPPLGLFGGNVIPLKNAAMISTTDGGYRFRAGQQNDHITISVVDGKLRFADTASREFRNGMPAGCTTVPVTTGVAADCPIPAQYDDANPMYVEVWPRLGDDYVDASSLPHMFRLWALVDAGQDTVLAGAGDDFVNGAMDADHVEGGGGNDWIRTGDGVDDLWGGPGNDKIVGGPGNDLIRGDDGDDTLYGISGGDSLWTGPGRDLASCGDGADSAFVDGSDRTNSCESVS